jgi:PAS domain S-box-containing protein
MTLIKGWCAEANAFANHGPVLLARQMMTNGIQRFLPLTVLLLIAAVFLVDLLTPLGGTAWVLYLPVILAPVWLINFKNLSFLPRQVLIASALCSVLVIVGLFLTHPNAQTWPVLRNRGMGLLGLWLTTFSAIIIQRRSLQLADAMKTLQQEIARHMHTSQLLEKTEKRLRLAVEGAGMGTFDVNMQTRKVVWSTTHLRMLGYGIALGGEATMDMWQSCVYPDDRDRIQEARERALRHRSLYSVEYRIKRADTGKIVWLAVFGRFLYDENGEAERFLGVSFDITRRKELEHEVLEITAREQQRIGQELHDGVGQEITGLGLMAQSLTQCLPESGSEKRIAVRLVAGLNQLHQQIRALARGLVPVEMEAKGLSAALDDLAANTSDQSGISVQFDCPEWVEMPDHGTSMELYRITQEAVSNALRHGRPRKIRLTMLTQPNGLRLRITDDGVGIPDRPMESKGLGIRIMEYRAALIGGVLRIDPAEGGGTVVTVTLPGSKANDHPETGSISNPNKNPDCR